MATHSSVLAWRIPGTEEPGGLPSMGSHRVKKTYTPVSLLLSRIQGCRKTPIQYTAAAVSLQSCPTLCSPMDCSLPGFSVHGILQARTLEWVAISFSNA